MKTLFKLFAAQLCAALLCTSALAHTPLAFSIPAHDATLQQAPAKVMLHFGDPVRLLSLDLTQHDQAIDFGFRRNSQANEHVEFALPALSAGRYELAWVAIGADGHRISGVIAFTVDPDATETTPGKHPEADEQHHHHAGLPQLFQVS